MTRLGEDDNTEEDADHDFLGVVGFFETHCYVLQVIDNIPNAPPAVLMHLKNAPYLAL